MLAVLGAACGRYPAVQDSTHAAGQTPPSDTSVPMRLKDGAPLVQVEIDGRGPYWFLIDTGSSITVVPPVLVRDLGLEGTGTPVSGRDVNGDPVTVGNAVVLHDVVLANTHLTNVSAVSMDLSPIFGTMKDPPVGVLGLDAFTDRVLTLDFPARRVDLKTAALPPPDGKDILAFDLGSDGSLDLAIEIGGRTVHAVLDTGDNGGLDLDGETAASLSFRSLISLGEYAAAGGEVRQQKLGRVAGDVHVGRYTFADPIAAVYQGPAPRIGDQWLDNFRVDLDVTNRRLSLARGEAGPIRAAPRPSLGIDGVCDAAGFEIHHVLPDAPAARLLSPGDRITAVDGRAVDDCRPIEEAAESEPAPKLTVLHGGESRQVAVPVIELFPDLGASSQKASGAP